MSGKEEFNCPHCNKQMLKWRVPVYSTWSSEFFYVCFNDDCPYFKKGWDVIQGSVNATASYRYRIDPETGHKGPLPVWSASALRDGIINE